MRYQMYAVRQDERKSSLGKRTNTSTDVLQPVASQIRLNLKELMFMRHGDQCTCHLISDIEIQVVGALDHGIGFDGINLRSCHKNQCCAATDNAVYACIGN